MRKAYKIEVDCANCASKIQEAIEKIDGVDKATVNFMTQKLVLEGDADKMDQLADAAEKAGKKIDDDFELIR